MIIIIYIVIIVIMMITIAILSLSQQWENPIIKQLGVELLVDVNL